MFFWEQKKVYKYLTFITVFYVVVLLVSNITAVKLTSFLGFTFDGGTILFPLAYIFGDVLTEVYGYKQTRKVIWMGFFMVIFSSLIIWTVGVLPPDDLWEHQRAYDSILGQVPRIVFASVIAYAIGEFSNSYILAKIKVAMEGRLLFVRTIASTLVAQGLDTMIFVFIAFYGVFPNDLLLIIIVSNYIFKVGVEILFTPLTCLVVGKLKKWEEEDYYDTETNFNPFEISEK